MFLCRRLRFPYCPVLNTDTTRRKCLFSPSSTILYFTYKYLSSNKSKTNHSLVTPLLKCRWCFCFFFSDRVRWYRHLNEHCPYTLWILRFTAALEIDFLFSSSWTQLCWSFHWWHFRFISWYICFDICMTSASTENQVWCDEDKVYVTWQVI